MYILQYSIAEDYLFTALNSSEEILGNDHNITQIIIKNLITLYQQSEKYVNQAM